MAKSDNGLRKRQQIQGANRTMFMWVAIASAIVGVAAVLSYTLFQQIMFKQTIIGEKNKTVTTLKHNNSIVDKLNESVRVLNSNEALLNTPHTDGTKPVSVVLDALPSGANSSALGASLQQKLLNVDGVDIESLVVNPVAGVEDDGSTATSVEGSAGTNEISFQFVVTTQQSNGDALKKVLKNLERSIRAIDVTTFDVEQQNGKIRMTIRGKSFYEPEKKVELTEKSVRP